MSSHKHQVRTCEKWGPKTYLQLLLITTGVAKKTKTDKMVTETKTHIITPHFKVWIVCVHTHREQTVKNFFSADTRGQHMFPLLCDGLSFNTAAYKMPLLNSVLVKSKKIDWWNIFFSGRTTYLSARVQSVSPRWMSWTWHQKRKRKKMERQKVKQREMRWKMRWQMSDERLAHIVLSRSFSCLDAKQPLKPRRIKTSPSVRKNVLLSTHFTHSLPCFRDWKQRSVRTAICFVFFLFKLAIMAEQRKKDWWLQIINLQKQVQAPILLANVTQINDTVWAKRGPKTHLQFLLFALGAAKERNRECKDCNFN